jgi:ribonuclease P protein component
VVLAVGAPDSAGQARIRLGLAVAREVGHAPARSRLRRLLREAFRALRTGWGAPADVVVLARRPWPDADLAGVVAELGDLGARLRLG